MSFLRRFSINFSLSHKYQIPFQALLLPLTLRRLPPVPKIESRYLVEKHFGNSMANFEKVPSSLFKYELFPESTETTVLDVEKERQKVGTEEVLNEFEGFSLERGSTGVIDVEEIVELMKREKAQDIFVVKVPPEFNYADYKVIVTGRSQRHMLAMADVTRRLYKKRVCSDEIPKLEGKNSKAWMAIDLGNIVLHIFSESSRQHYDLESLWAVGGDYDSITHSKSTPCDDVTDYVKILASLTPNP